MDRSHATKFLSIFFFDEKKTTPKNITTLQKEQIEQLKNKRKEKGFPPTLWRKFNKHFKITSYKHLAPSSFQEGLKWLENYPKNEKNV